MLHRIVLPLDGSAMAEAVFARIRPLFEKTRAEAILVQVIDIIPATAGPAVYPGPTAAMELIESLERGGRDYLEACAARIREAGTAVTVKTAIGPAADFILSTAEEEDASLVAMTTHGRTGLSRWIQGSVTERVLRGARRPLLVLPSFRRSSRGQEDLWETRILDPRRILVPLDGSEASRAILPQAALWARTFGAALDLLHVQVWSHGVRVDALGRDEIEKEARRLREEGIGEVRTLVRSGDPAGQILDTALDQGHDLVAMSSHGRSGPSRWLLGSVAEKVFRTSVIPVLAVRSPAK